MQKLLSNLIYVMNLNMEHGLVDRRDKIGRKNVCEKYEYGRCRH